MPDTASKLPEVSAAARNYAGRLRESFARNTGHVPLRFVWATKGTDTTPRPTVVTRGRSGTLYGYVILEANGDRCASAPVIDYDPALEIATIEDWEANEDVGREASGG